MRQFLTGVLVSELFALWVEFFYKFGVKFNPKAFVIAIPLYFLFLVFLHKVFSKLEGIRFFILVCTILGGLFGLAVEWVLVGNSPWGNPNALQWAQFVVHAVYPILGYLLARVTLPVSYKTSLRRYCLVTSVVTALGFIMSNPNLQKLWILFLPIISFFGLLYFVYKLSDYHTSSGTKLHDISPS